jgi:hypothetical protein
MSTWVGKAYKGKTDAVGWENSEPVSFHYSYQTTADFLTIYRNNEVLVSLSYTESRLFTKAILEFASSYLGVNVEYKTEALKKLGDKHD